MVSVVIPVRNGGEDLRRCLEAIAAQRLDDELEVVVVDSSSEDGSAELARSLGAAVHTIPVAEFNHGRTRNLGARLASGEILVFTSQDAYAEGTEWLAELTLPLAQDDQVAGVYGRQLPHADATPPERFFLDFLYGPAPRVQQADGPDALSMETVLFSNVNAAIRREHWERHPFVDDVVMSEDQVWATRVLLDGLTLRYEPAAAVRHSHRYTILGAFRRFFDSGASADRAYLPASPAAERALRQRAKLYAREELAWLWREGHRLWIPYAAVYELAKYTGLRAGTQHRRLPTAVKRRLSAHPAYWHGAAARQQGSEDAAPASSRTFPSHARGISKARDEALVSEPRPSQCVACAGRLEPWICAEPQEPTLRSRYLLLRCLDCGTASTAGTAPPELYETGVYESGTTRFAAAVEAVRRLYERQRLVILRRTVRGPARVLDAGAGQGRFVLAARQAGYDAEGFEPSASGVQRAAARGIELQRAGLDDADIAPASFDAATLSHVLEHLGDPGAALDRVATWLRPGGALLIGVPNIDSVQARIGGGRWLHLDVPRHRHHFTPDGLARLLARHGYGIEDERHLLIEHNPFGMWQAWADRLTSTPAYAYNLVKRNARPNARDLAATAAVALLAPVAVLAEIAAALRRRGGTIVVVARLR